MINLHTNELFKTVHFFISSIFILCYFSSGAQDTLSSPSPVPQLLEVVNDPNSVEFAPTLSADGKTLIFESDRDEGKWKLFQSKLNENDEWSVPTALDKINDACDFIAGPNLSYDGNTLFFTAFIEGESQSEDIYYSIREGEEWSLPKKLEGPINTDQAFEGFSSISSDENSLFFIRLNEKYDYDIKTDEDCFVIYLSKKYANGEWSEPELLPDHINTGCVRDPKIMADNRTLLFSSIAVGKKDKYNLYQSQLGVDSKWSEPIPLDYVNSELDNLSPTISSSGDKMIYYSDGELYSIYIPPEYRQFFNANMTGFVTDSKTGAGLSADIFIEDAKNLEVISKIVTNPIDGGYSLILNAGRNYKVTFRKKGYLSQYFKYNFYYLNQSTQETKHIEMKSEADVGVLVFDKDMDRLIEADIVVLSSIGEMIDQFHIASYTEESNAFELDINKNYMIVASAKNYESDSISISTTTSNLPTLKLYLKPIKVKYTFNVKSLSSNKRVRSRITLKNESRDEIIAAYSDEDIYLRQGDRYSVMASGDRGYLFSTTTIVVGSVESQDDDQSSEIEHDMSIAEITLNSYLILNNITFESNAAELSPESLMELEGVIKLLQNNPDIQIEISAHTDDIGTDEFNLDLSVRRARSVKEYMVRNNIPHFRMTSVGYGESNSIVPNDNEENRTKNRRVEIKVTALN